MTVPSLVESIQSFYNTQMALTNYYLPMQSFFNAHLELNNCLIHSVL
jgi:hypothetical protein